jgi:hypothetical protein
LGIAVVIIVEMSGTTIEAVLFTAFGIAAAGATVGCTNAGFGLPKLKSGAVLFRDKGATETNVGFVALEGKGYGAGGSLVIVTGFGATGTAVAEDVLEYCVGTGIASGYWLGVGAQLLGVTGIGAGEAELAGLGMPGRSAGDATLLDEGMTDTGDAELIGLGLPDSTAGEVAMLAKGLAETGDGVVTTVDAVPTADVVPIVDGGTRGPGFGERGCGPEKVHGRSTSSKLSVAARMSFSLI